MIALTNEVSPRLNECELTYLDREPIDIERARRQHDAYGDCLERNGLRVKRLCINQDYPDSVFVEDTAVVVDEVAVMMSMGADTRMGEVAAMAGELSRYRTLKQIERPALIDGGDVLRVGRRLWAGLTTRTDEAGVKALSDTLAPYGYEVNAVPMKQALHLKSAVTALDDETLIVNRAAVGPDPFDGFRLIDVPEEEPGAANVLRVGGRICLHAGYIRTIDRLHTLGYETDPVDMSELLKAESGVTCSSIIFQE